MSDYSKLHPSTKVEGNALAYASTDAVKNLHKYIAVIVEPVQIYVATNADISKMTSPARGALANYYRGALTAAVADAFPVVEEKGPLVLRLRSAIVGVDVGGETAESDKNGGRLRSPREDDQYRKGRSGNGTARFGNGRADCGLR